MKVLEVYADFLPRRGGVATYIYDVSKTLLEEGHKPEVLVWNPPAPSFEIIDGITVHRFKIPQSFSNLRYLRLLYLAVKVRSIVKSNEIDIIHAHDYFPGLACTIAAKFSKTPVVTTFHLPIDKTSYIASTTQLPPLIAVEQSLKRFFINNIRAITCVSSFTYKETLKLGFPPSKLQVIYNWFTPTKTSKENSDILKRFRFGKEGFVLSVGRLDEKQKCFSELINAFKLLIDRSHDLNLVIVGTGPSKTHYESLIARLQLKERVHLLGNLENSDLQHIYDKCSVFVLSSSFEGLPLVVLEAMNHDKPVVATKVGGLTELIRDGDNGILVELKPESIASGIEKVLSNPDLADLFVQRSRELLSNKFSIKNCKEIVQILEVNASRS